MNPPPNPNAAAARADMQAYNATVKALRGDPQIAPTPPADLLDRVFDHWLDMERYRATARIERVNYWLSGERHWTWFVTVTV